MSQQNPSLGAKQTYRSAVPENQKKQKAKNELSEAIGHSKDVLFRAKTVFPMTLIPDTLTIDRTKLTITHRDFFKVAEILSISIEDILNVAANVGPFFGHIVISTRFFDPDRPYRVRYFWREDALKIKRIMQGYIIAKQKEVDCTALSTRELARTLDELGKVASPDKV